MADFHIDHDVALDVARLLPTYGHTAIVDQSPADRIAQELDAFVGTIQSSGLVWRGNALPGSVSAALTVSTW